MISPRPLTFGVILPNTKIFGGVKRFFEIGNILIRLGHQFTIFTPEGKYPDWFQFNGNVIRLENFPSFHFDAVFITQPDYLHDLKKADAAIKVFYVILNRAGYLKKIKNDPDLILLANSTILYEALGGGRKKNLFKAIGGIDLQKFSFHQKSTIRPGGPFIVMAYGRFYKKKKGTMLVVRACEDLYKNGYNIKLHLFDTPTDKFGEEQLRKFRCEVPYEFFIDYPVKDLPELYYKADVFVSAERNAGWSNTSAEAMACGVPVIATRSGTTDFLIHKQTGLCVWRHPWFIKRAIKTLYRDITLRHTLALHARSKIEKFSWENVAGKIEEVINENLPAQT